MKTILCFGDSNTWGYNDQDTQHDIPGRFDISTRWTGKLATNLGSEYRIIEEGLNGRTTVFEDPLWNGRSGKPYLESCVDSHRPLDLVMIMLGTNDLKIRFSVSAVDIARGLENLVDLLERSRAGLQTARPQILLVAPAPVGKIAPCDEPSWVGAQEKARELPRLYEELAHRRKCHFANTQAVLSGDELAADGIHLSAKGHAKLADFFAEKIKSILH